MSEAATLSLVMAVQPAIGWDGGAGAPAESRRAFAVLERARHGGGASWTDLGTAATHSGASNATEGTHHLNAAGRQWQQPRRRLKGGGGGGDADLDGEIQWRNPSFGSFDDFFSSMTLLYVMSTLDDWEQESRCRLAGGVL